MSNMQIRSFQDSDEGAVIRLWERCGLLRPWNDPRKDIARKRRVQKELFLVGTVDGAIVASVMAGYDGHRGWIYSVAVSPAHRRRGVGAQLVRFAERALAGKGCVKVNLQIMEGNESVAAFYGALGFSVEKRVSMGKRIHENIDAA